MTPKRWEGATPGLMFIERTWPIIAMSALLGLLVWLKAWPALAWAAPQAFYMVIRQALYEHHLMITAPSPRTSRSSAPQQSPPDSE